MMQYITHEKFVKSSSNRTNPRHSKFNDSLLGFKCVERELKRSFPSNMNQFDNFVTYACARMKVHIINVYLFLRKMKKFIAFRGPFYFTFHSM